MRAATCMTAKKRGILSNKMFRSRVFSPQCKCRHCLLLGYILNRTESYTHARWEDHFSRVIQFRTGEAIKSHTADRTGRELDQSSLLGRLVSNKLTNIKAQAG